LYIANQIVFHFTGVSLDAIFTVLRLFKYDEVQLKGADILLSLCKISLRHNPEELARHLGVVQNISCSVISYIVSELYNRQQLVTPIEDGPNFGTIGTVSDNTRRKKML